MRYAKNFRAYGFYFRTGYRQKYLLMNIYAKLIYIIDILCAKPYNLRITRKRRKIYVDVR